MSTATKTSIPIVGDSFSIYCDANCSVEVMSYISGQIKHLEVSYVQKNNGFKMASIAASADGYYFVRSGKNVQSLKKGNAAYKLFVFDSLKRDNLELHPESYDENGTKIGDNQWECIGFGIYSILPLVSTYSTVMVLGESFHCFPDVDIVKYKGTNRATTIVGLDVNERPTTISIGGTSADLSVNNTKVGLKVGQTIFKV